MPKPTINPQLYIEELKENETPFTITQTAGGTIIETEHDRARFYQNGNLNGYDLQLIMKVKKYAQSLKISNFKYYSSKDIEFINNGGNLKRNELLTNDLYEIDLNAAYWVAAKYLGIISEDIYNYANNGKCSKSARLIALGNLAKRPVISVYNGKEFEKPIQPPELETSRLFYACAYYASIKMHEMRQLIQIINPKNYLCTWVDAIFFKGEDTRKFLTAHLDYSQTGYKIYKIDKIKRLDNKILIKSKAHKKELRIFNFHKIKKIKL